MRRPSRWPARQLPMAIDAIGPAPVDLLRLPAMTRIVPQIFDGGACPMAGGGRGACRPLPPHAPGGRRARCVRRGEADRDPALRVTSGMSAIRTHVRAQCEEQARLEHMFVRLKSGSPWRLGCADTWLIGIRAGGPGAVPRVAASACAVPSTESGTLAALARLGPASAPRGNVKPRPAYLGSLPVRSARLIRLQVSPSEKPILATIT
jgi:hypothetical protein